MIYIENVASEGRAKMTNERYFFNQPSEEKMNLDQIKQSFQSFFYGIQCGCAWIKKNWFTTALFGICLLLVFARLNRIYQNQENRELALYTLAFLACVAAWLGVIFSIGNNRTLCKALEEATEEIHQLRSAINTLNTVITPGTTKISKT